MLAVNLLNPITHAASVVLWGSVLVISLVRRAQQDGRDGVARLSLMMVGLVAGCAGIEAAFPEVGATGISTLLKLLVAGGLLTVLGCPRRYWPRRQSGTGSSGAAPDAPPAQTETIGDPPGYGSIIDMSPDAIFLCRNGNLSVINAAGLRLLHCDDANRLAGQPFSKLVHPDYRMLCEGNFGPLISETAATPMKFLHPSGKALDVVVSATVAPEGNGSVLVVVHNISDVMRANRDVAAQVKRLNSILDTAVDAIVVTDEQGNIETFNRSAETMFGYAANPAIGQPIEMLMTEDGAKDHRKQAAKILTQHQPYLAGSAGEIAGRRQDGSVFPTEISLSLCHLDDRRLFTAIFRDVTERRSFEDFLTHSANHDSLTGLPNRRLVQDQLQRTIDHASLNKACVAVWFIDLDGFKMVNDVMGHIAGDELLIAAGRRMVSAVRQSDTVARFGGDEFTIINRNIRNRTEVTRAVERFLDVLSRPFTLRGRELTLTANIGIALYPEHAVQASELIVHASAATVVAKATGQNLFRFFDPVMHSRSAERLTLENELRRGIEREELLLHYQPQFDVTSGRIVGLEALVRWAHPTMGLIAPTRFIPIAEQTGLIVPLGAWVLRQACKDMRTLDAMGYGDISVGVNISARQFSDSDVPNLILTVIEETGINPRNLDVEITESTLMHNPEHVIDYLDRMKALGITLSIDDFGTGYSSLNYLKRFPVDTLKIDRSFVTDIATSSKDKAIAVTIITLAHSMGMSALAEGVEHPHQAEILAFHGCDVIQGFLYSKPLPLNEVTSRLMGSAHLAMAKG
jgi:diguanylate cyclase (GGDEF)-like protein/PAS domain S-box-containing protein